jgi:Arc/MetJ family transcription regulator
VRTTIDIPDDLFRQIKARAAVQGLKLKDYVTQALRDSLYRHQSIEELRATATRRGKDVLVLREDCVLPQIVGDTSEELRTITEERIDEILVAEEAADALRPGRR